MHAGHPEHKRVRLRHSADPEHGRDDRRVGALGQGGDGVHRAGQQDAPPNRQDRRTLPNGAAFFGASGKVTNVGSTRRTIPPILIVLRDSRERIVYTWEVAPPKRQLAPGESVTINEAVTDVPKSAKIAEIGWKPG